MKILLIILGVVFFIFGSLLALAGFDPYSVGAMEPSTGATVLLTGVILILAGILTFVAASKLSKKTSN